MPSLPAVASGAAAGRNAPVADSHRGVDGSRIAAADLSAATPPDDGLRLDRGDK